MLKIRESESAVGEQESDSGFLRVNLTKTGIEVRTEGLLGQ